MSWDVLTGVFDWRVDEGLRDAGRLRFHRVRGREPDAGSESRGPTGLQLSARWAFASRREPRRLAVVSLHDQDSLSPAVTAWADDATAVLEGVPATPHAVAADETWGDLGLAAMLEPIKLETVAPPPWTSTFRIEGNSLDENPQIAPELVSLGADRYEAEFDPRAGATHRLGGDHRRYVALRQTLTHLTPILG